MPKAETKIERRDAARERARAMREAAARKQRQRRILAVSGGIVAVLVIVAVVAVLISRGSSSSTSARPAGVNANGGIVTGTAGAAHAVTIYQDYQCPYCKAFEASADTWLKQQADAGTLTVEFRPISFLDASSNGNEYSTRAANAAACVAGTSSIDFFDWNTAMYDQQPAEGETGRSDSELIAVAKKAGAGSAVGRCIVGQDHKGWVAQTTKTAMSAEGGVTGTPTVLVDGKVVTGSGGANTVPSLADVQKALGI